MGESFFPPATGCTPVLVSTRYESGLGLELVMVTMREMDSPGSIVSASAAGDTCITGGATASTPMPITTSDSSGSSLAMVSVPLMAAVVVGVNATATSIFWFGTSANVDGCTV